MRIGFIGLGRMGANMVRRLLRDGHEIVAYNRTPEKTREIATEGATAAFSIEELVSKLEKPRAVWIMVPAGDATEAQIDELLEHLEPGDTIIDGGNTNFHDDVRRHEALKARGIGYVDAGTSGGIWGLQVGYALMVGGEREQVAPLEPVFTSLAPEGGYLHVGGPGAGHYVKMIHNGIEYGLMQAYAEGFDIMKGAAATPDSLGYRYDIDLADVAELWRRGSVVTSWLLDLTATALAKSGTLEGFSGVVSDSGEGRWTVEAAVEQAVPADVLTSALYTRFRSRQDHTFAEKVLSAMRAGFGGHVEPGKGK
jgi:6-phosphogluconate dehydrogenase